MTDTEFGPGAIDVDDLCEADLDALVDLHLAAFPHSELGQLGREAVRRHYRWQVHGPHDLTALVARSDGVIVGFLLGGLFRGSTIGFVKQERRFLVGQVLRHPAILFRASGRRVIAVAVRLLLRRGRSMPEQPGRVPVGSFGVLVVAVDPESHRLGIGASLLRVAEERARRGGFTRMHLTLHPGNVAALSFYTDQGWHHLALPGDDSGQQLIGKDLGGAGGA